MDYHSHLFFANMPYGVTPASHAIYHLHMLSFFICLGIVLTVSIIFSFFLIRYRKSFHPRAMTVHSNLLIEIAWIAVPVILLVIMGAPATLFLLHYNRPSNNELNIEVTGYQWKWKYEYLDYHFGFFSNLSTPLAQILGNAPKDRWYLLETDQPLIVPVHTKLRFLVTSNDVVHSWWVPVFGIKRDAIPGFIYESTAIVDQPGIYRGQCAELCGVHHGFMPIVIEAKTQADFAAWVAQKQSENLITAAPAKKDFKALMSEGESVYQSQCAVCHQLNGQGMPPTFPALQGGKMAIGPVERHIDIVVHGKPFTAMPAFGNQLSAEQIAAVITYERNSWGNNNQIKYGPQAGGTVTPDDIEH